MKDSRHQRPPVHTLSVIYTLLIALTAAFLTTPRAYSDALTDTEHNTIQLLLLMHDTESAHNDVLLHVRWYTDDSEARDKAIRIGQKAMNHAIERVQQLRANRDSEVHRSCLAMLEAQQHLYEVMSATATKKQSMRFSFTDYHATLTAFTDQARQVFPPTTNSLHQRADCLTPEEDHEQWIACLAEQLAGDYSPELAVLWRDWRALYQGFNHGMSNYSVIPNELYNRKRREIVQIIEAHLNAHPGDDYACAQLRYLAWKPSILRGGPMGHWCIADWGAATGSQNE